MSTETTTPTVHDLKVWTTFYDLLDSGMKTFELRRNDRGYKVGVVLRLREWRISDQTYTGRELMRTITHVMAGGQFGIEPHHVALLFAPVMPPHRNQYDELLHFALFATRPADYIDLAGDVLRDYCRQFNIPVE